ncbi:MAG TPA: hypothetical protein VLB44_01965 [Kofleriaceae bacterium]|nr:hypothetical protein [Kofleriaceae bacterium]
MGSFLHDVEIDWGWPFLSEEERAIVRRHEARLQSDRKSYTVETAMLVLAGAARDLPDRLLRARAIDDDHTYYWQIVEGEIYDGHEFDEAGMFPEELTAEDFHAAGVTIVLTPVAIPDSMYQEINERDATLSELVQDAWQAASDELPPGFRSPTGPRHMHSIYLPVEMWADLKDRAKFEERSISYLVQRAVTAAYALPVE